MASANHVQNFSVEEQTINLLGVRAGLELSKQVAAQKKIQSRKEKKSRRKGKTSKLLLDTVLWLRRNFDAPECHEKCARMSSVRPGKIP